MSTSPSITIETFLNGLFVNFDLPQKTIDYVLAKRDIVAGSPAYQRDASGKESESWARKRELAMADAYFSMSTILGGGGKSKQLGNRRFVDMSITVSAADRAYWRELANQYYRKYDEVVVEEADIYDGGFGWKK